MIGHDHIFINGNIPVKIIHFQQRLLRDNSAIRKADVWGVEDADPYKCKIAGFYFDMETIYQ